MINELLKNAVFATMSFQGIHGNSEEISVQKNILAETVRFVYPEPSVFVEETAGTSLSLEGDSEHARLVIKCIQCLKNAFNHQVARDSIKYTSDSGNLNVANITFSTFAKSNVENVFHHWKIEIREKQLYFGIFAEKPIRAMQPLDKSFFSVSACVANVRCSSEKSYLKFNDAIAAIDDLQERLPKKNYTIGKPIHEADFEIPNQVNKNDTVKVIFKKESGLTLRTLGKAIQPGRLGDSIDVSILKGEKSFDPPAHRYRSSLTGGRGSSSVVRARVSANGEVEIEN